MEDAMKKVMQDCTEASDEERITFPEVVGRLAAAGVERYHADLQRHEKVYYMPDGRSHAVASRPVEEPVAMAFSATGVAAAVGAAQAVTIQYGEFCRRIQRAGCVGYFVSMSGRRAVYFGRSSECHVEHFPT